MLAIDVEWGTVAEWVSGIGTLLALAVALGVAIYEHRQAKLARGQAEQARQRAEAANLRIESEKRERLGDAVPIFECTLKTYRHRFTDVQLLAGDQILHRIPVLHTGNKGGKVVEIELTERTESRGELDIDVKFVDQELNRWKLNTREGRLDRVP